MQRALELAQNGLGFVSPNPLVGCVIVHENKIIGEGWHKKFGDAHAEVNAINAVEQKDLLSKSTLYVTLEPCAHFGKTPPCADLIIKHQIPRVIICNTDPFEKVNGKGIEKLRNAGIEVITSVLEDEGKELNRRFFTLIQKNRPYVILKWAQTEDGFIAKENFDSKWISNELSRKTTHKWRTEEDAILVGFNTAFHDNPQLTARDWQGKNPLRMVIDRDLKLSLKLHLFSDGEATVCFNQMVSEKKDNVDFIKIDFQKLEENILLALKNRDIGSVIIEGGAKTINGFLSKNLWDEARVFVANKKFKKGIKSPMKKFPPHKKTEFDSDQLLMIKNPDA